MAYAEIVFSETQQLALIGYALTSQGALDSAIDFGVTSTWFVNANAQLAWKAMESWYKEFKKAPTVEELKSHQVLATEAALVKTKTFAAIDRGVAVRTEIGWEGLVKNLGEWSAANTMRATVEKLVEQWNRGDIAMARASFTSGFMDMERVEKKTIENRFQSVADRVKLEEAQRLAQKDQILSYGVPYLDDALGGILPNDVVLIGAKSGKGKTQLATLIASHNAERGKRVAYLALEAEEFEVERRLKFGLASRAYRASDVPNKRFPSYSEWRLCRSEDILGEWSPKINNFMERYRTMTTMYRKSGDYGVTEMERDITRLAPDVDLIVIDHLHYVDTDSDKNENGELKSIVKKLRDLALGLGKPIVVVAHMRKTQKAGKYTPLVPDLEDFHGSSDIIKIATTAIIIGGYRGDPLFVHQQQRERMLDKYATFFRVAKCRLEGDRLSSTGVVWFNPSTGTYETDYAIGRLTDNDSEWEPLTRLPVWAKNCAITLNATNT